MLVVGSTAAVVTLGDFYREQSRSKSCKVVAVVLILVGTRLIFSQILAQQFF